MVFVHGSGGNHASWFYQIHAFSSRCRVITIDQRGFGNSEDVEGRGRSAMVDDLGGVFDHLESRARCSWRSRSAAGPAPAMLSAIPSGSPASCCAIP